MVILQRIKIGASFVFLRNLQHTMKAFRIFAFALAVSVTMVTDPGAVVPPLPPDLPATLLDAAVRSVRGIPATDGLAR